VLIFKQDFQDKWPFIFEKKLKWVWNDFLNF